MKTVILRRIAENGSGAYGVLIIDGQPRCITLEHPWQDNAQDISCIPPGNYTLRKFHSDAHGETWQVTPVPGRGTILIHVGNTLRDTQGCILVGQEYGTEGIRESRHAMRKLRAALGDNDLIPFIVRT